MRMSRRAAMRGGMVVDPVLDNNSWEAIRAASDAGMASRLWSVGDRKQVTLNGTVGYCAFNNYSTYAFIIGFDHNSALEGDRRIHFQLGKTALSGGKDICLCDNRYDAVVSAIKYFSMNKSRTNGGGWGSSQKRVNICGTSLSSFSGTLIGAMPTELRAVLKAVTKYTDNSGGYSGSVAANVTATTEYIFELAEFELFGAITYANTWEADKQAQYAYYSAGNSKIKYKHNSQTAAAAYLLRSLRAGGTSTFAYVNANGAISDIYADTSSGFAPCFCV